MPKSDNVVKLRKDDDEAPSFNIKEKDIKSAAEKAHEELEKMVSYFDKSLRKQRKKLKKNKQNLSDSEGNVAVLKSLLEMMIKLIPTAEKVYKKYKNERGAYAIVALVTQTREISADIQRYSSSQKNATILTDTIIIPAIQLVLQHYMSTNAQLIKKIKGSMGKKEANVLINTINESMMDHSSYLKQIMESVGEKTSSYFGDK